MTNQELKRKLTAILSADVEGYSRLMGEDELNTIHTLKRYKAAITKLVENYRGRVVDAPGDNLLAEFVSVVDAVQCAVEIQRELAARNAELPDEHKMQFRIGVNLGEHEVRNIREPVKAYRVLMTPEFDGKLIGFEKQTQSFRWMGIAAVIVFIVIGVLIYQVYQSKQIRPVNEALAEKPSIAVLPFDNMSNDPEQEYFSNGISENL